MKKLSEFDGVLGELTPAQFLRDYWHKKPLLIRQALPGFKALLSSAELFALAAREDVESRLVTKDKTQWKMQNGPFERMPAARQKEWTLLVQGVNLHDDNADALLRLFRFIPDARLDDLMISYANSGGGVGPHFDSYDVFLLQAEGQRRWQIGAQQDLTLVEGAPLKILQNFTPDETFVLEPGDMLYLPPHYAHDGVAIGACMTYSIGFRAPTYQELGEAFLDFMVETIDLPARYADPDLTPTANPAEISKVMLRRVADELNKVRFTEEDIGIFLGEYLSEPKASVFFDPPEKEFSPAAFDRAIARHGVALSRKTQMLYRGRTIFINGESFDAGGPDKALLTALANARRLDGAALQEASDDLRESLFLWYQDGWLRLNNA
ncbi:cupin domain-containing protein [Oxalobacteraceae bacterium CAVE-383]|nr:cupin domain-containing protein [Oxalobacteraceae bacterium CAVE-383]